MNEDPPGNLRPVNELLQSASCPDNRLCDYDTIFVRFGCRTGTCRAAPASSSAFGQNAYLSCLMDNSGAFLTPDGRFSNAIPFFVAVLATGLFLLMLITGVMQTTGGFYSYPLDDPYIHMQIGKNLAFNGTWGIKPAAFESASSSILFPLLIAAAFRIFGVHDMIPLWLNGIAGVMLLFVANKWLLKQSFSVLPRTLLLLLAVFLMPLPVIISTGMEHCFQTLTAFLFLTTLSDYPAKTDEKERRRLRMEMVMYALLLTGFRYEGLFLIAAAAIVLLWYRQYRPAVAVMVAGILPVVVFGLYSLSKGSYFLPNPVILKSYFPVSVHDFPGFARLLFNNFLLGPMDGFPGQICFLATERLLFFLPLLYLLIGKYKPGTGSFMIFVPTLFFGVLFHLVFASTGWFFRYEAYLIFCGVIVISASLYKTMPLALPWKDPVAKLFAMLLLVFLVAPALSGPGRHLKKTKPPVSIFLNSNARVPGLSVSFTTILSSRRSISVPFLFSPMRKSWTWWDLETSRWPGIGNRIRLTPNTSPVL